ncbi:MAG: hypothetical protein C4519_01240 [Desulfobacteraceae bacterium]|nr:MAG: hypothetical protein C4519_01240 [Desulfobacteraceae bacterium]
MDLKKLQDTPPWEWPANADQVLLGILSDQGGDPTDRLLAAELSGDYTVISDALAQALLDIVRNGNESLELRSTAVIALGPAMEHADMMGFEDEDDILISEELFHHLQETLHLMYMRADLPTELRRRILEAAVRAPQVWHHDAVRSAYADSDPSWRLTAVFCMGYVSGFDQQILESLGNPDPLIHYHAVSAAGNWEIDEAWPHIAELVRSDETEKDLRIAAIAAAATIHPEEASMLLTDLMESDDEDIVEAVLEALAMADGLEGFENFDDEDED